MKIIKKSLLIMFIVSLFVIQVYASEKTLLDMNKTETEQFIVNLIYASAKEDIDYFNANALRFEGNCYYDIKEFISNNNIDSNEIGEILVDFTYPEYSSTGDSVIMANAKIWYDNRSYNKAYLFEYHINKQGNIYGFNCWVY